MTEPALEKRVYEYKIGYFSQLFGVFVTFTCWFAGLLFIVRTLETGQGDKIPLALIISAFCFLVGGILMRWLQRDSRSSKQIAFHDDKVQRPMTKGDRDEDYVLFADMLDVDIDQNYADHGPALIVATRKKPIVYKSMYFASHREFDNFCKRLERELLAKG